MLQSIIPLPYEMDLWWLWLGFRSLICCVVWWWCFTLSQMDRSGPSSCPPQPPDGYQDKDCREAGGNDPVARFDEAMAKLESQLLQGFSTNTTPTYQQDDCSSSGDDHGGLDTDRLFLHGESACPKRKRSYMTSHHNPLSKLFCLSLVCVCDDLS